MRVVLRARNQGRISRNYEITEDGRPVTEWIRWRRADFDFTMAGVTFRVSREGNTRFLLDAPGGRAASADRVTGRRWTVTTAAGGMELVRTSLVRVRWDLHRDGQVVGRIALPPGWFPRYVEADLPADLPLAVRVFTFYVALVLWEGAVVRMASGGLP